MKILTWSNSPHQFTGYGIQTRHQCRIFEQLGHVVGVAANSGLSGTAINWRGIPIYPVHRHPFGFDVLGHYVNQFAADVVLTLYDHWAFPPAFRDIAGTTWVAQTPIDGTPIHGHLRRVLRSADYVVTYSRFGHDELEDAGVPSTYIPHCIDTGIYRPGDRAAAREALGIDADRFMLSVIAMNKDRIPSRKSWPEILQAYARFQRDVPEALLYCHTTKYSFTYGSDDDGISFDPLVADLEIPQEAMAFPPTQALAVGIQDEDMATIYQASDVVLLPSMAEGFGLPVIEAQACGIPVITIDAHTGPELTHLGFVTRPLTRQWIPKRNYWWAQADVDQILQAMWTLYEHPPLDESRHDAAAWVDRHYSIPAVTPAWKELWERVEAEAW